MSKLLRVRLSLCWIVPGLLCLAASSAQAADSVVWHKESKTLDAQVESWDLKTLLQRLAGATHWRILVEPGTQEQVSVKFKNLPLGEGLKRIFGTLNFALLPQTNAPSTLFVFRDSLQDATQLINAGIQNADGSHKGVIPNELVVTMRPGAKGKIDALARSLGAKVVGRVDGLNTYRLQFADEASAQAARDSLTSNPDVAATDSNYYIEQPTRAQGLEASTPSSFGIKPKQGNAGNQTIVALIDTPVQSLESKFTDFMLPAVHVAGDANLPADQLTHGTSMAETILKGLNYAPTENGGSSVRILPIDVYGSNTDTTTFDVANGIYTAVAAGASIVNLSLGGAGDSSLLASLIHSAHDQGVLFMGAAGNQPTTDNTYPAAYPDVVAVTAGDKSGNIAPYANRGSFVDVIAPGISVVDYAGQSYLVRGTSAATAYVSGAAAGYRASGSSAATVEAYLRQNWAVH